MSRRDRFTESDISIERYEDRRDYASRGGRGRGGEERYFEEDIEYRSRGPPPREQRERGEVIIKEREREDVRYRDGPEILRDDYGRSSAGALVLRKRETEDYEYAPRSRRMSPSPHPEPKTTREEIIIRRNSPSPERPPPRRERDTEREEIIIRRDERSRDRRPPPPREFETDREEVIIRRDERDRRGPVYEDIQREEITIRRDDDRHDRRPPPPRDFDREEIIIRRDEDRQDKRPPPPRDFDREEIIIRRDDDRHDRRPPPPRDFDREEIIIRRDDRDEDRISRVTSRGRDDYALSRPISHERERSRVGRGSTEHEHDDEIIIRRDEREGGRGGDRQREEIIIRKQSRSPSPASSYRAPPPVEPAPIYAPPIHREIIYHERHIDHGYETALARIPSRAPSPPMPPPPPPQRDRSEERIEIRRTGERNGRAYDEDIIIDRNNEGHRAPRRVPEPEPAPARGPYREEIDIIREDRGPRGVREEVDIIREERGPRGYRRDETDIQEEADFYNQRTVERSYMGEGLHGATRDWAIVDVPPGTQRVRLDGVGGGSQEISWQRYNGVRRSKFMPDGSPSDEGYGSEVGRPLPVPVPVSVPVAGAVAGAGAGAIGPRYGPRRKEGEGLWTEITKDLVVKEAIKQAGYEFEETDDFYYIMSYLKYVSWFFTFCQADLRGFGRHLSDTFYRKMWRDLSGFPMTSKRPDYEESRSWNGRIAS
jgi:hypothetical protein